MSKIRTRRKGKNFFITGSNVSGLVNSTTVSSSIFTKMSQSFADGEHLIDDAIRESNGGMLFMLQELQDDVDDIYTQISSSQYAPLDNSHLQATTGSFTSLDISGNIDVDSTANLDIVDIDGPTSFASRTVFEPQTFTANDATPDVRGGRVFKTNNGSLLGNCTITGFDNGEAGQIIHIIHMDTKTDYTDGTNLQLVRGLDHTSAQTNDTITFVCVDGTKWVELGRSDNT